MKRTFPMKRTLLYAAGVYALIIGFGIFLKISHGAEMTCRHSLEVCEKSCANREGMFKFQCMGDSYLTDGPKYKCMCGDQYETELIHQRTLVELRKLQASRLSTEERKK